MVMVCAKYCNSECRKSRIHFELKLMQAFSQNSWCPRYLNIADAFCMSQTKRCYLVKGPRAQQKCVPQLQKQRLFAALASPIEARACPLPPCTYSAVWLATTVIVCVWKSSDKKIHSSAMVELHAYCVSEVACCPQFLPSIVELIPMAKELSSRWQGRPKGEKGWLWMLVKAVGMNSP